MLGLKAAFKKMIPRSKMICYFHDVTWCLYIYHEHWNILKNYQYFLLDVSLKLSLKPINVMNGDV